MYCYSVTDLFDRKKNDTPRAVICDFGNKCPPLALPQSKFASYGPEWMKAVALHCLVKVIQRNRQKLPKSMELSANQAINTAEQFYEVPKRN